MANIYKDGFYVGTVEIKSTDHLRTLEKDFGVEVIKNNNHNNHEGGITNVTGLSHHFTCNKIIC